MVKEIGRLNGDEHRFHRLISTHLGLHHQISVGITGWVVITTGATTMRRSIGNVYNNLCCRRSEWQSVQEVEARSYSFGVVTTS